jgi:hypothetical protein
MAKLKKGTSQSIHLDQTDKYHIEIWNGNMWSTIVIPNFETKREADEYGFANYPDHKR